MSLKSPSKEEGIWDIEDIEEKAIKPNQWVAVGSRTFKPASVSHGKLPAGCYAINKDNNDGQPIFIRKDIKNDLILSFKESLSQELLKEIEYFWGQQQKFKDNGFLHRRGYLLYGSQGTGKSSIVWQVAQNLIEKGGIVFTCEFPTFFIKGLSTFRQVEPDRPVVCIFEDIDAIISKYGDSEILQLLDGDSQIDRVINIATTNYPEKLDKRIVSRPRRFDRIHKILVPSDAIRIQYLKQKLPKNCNQKEWIKKTKGLSFAALTECIISVICLDNDLDETVTILKDIESKEPKISDFGSGVGFMNDKEDE